MAITQAICNSYKQEILSGVHTSAHVYKIALYTSTATMDASTTVYATTNEITGTGYSAGGATLAGFTTALTSSTANLTWSDPSWASATFTARGALIYNSSVSNKAVMVIDFGSDITATAGTFTVDLPPSGATALIRIT